MAIVPITKDNLERFKIQTSPKRTLISSSNGLTGSIAVFGRTSPREKDAFPPADFTSAFDSSTIEQARLYAVNKNQNAVFNGATGSNISGNMESYLEAVNNAPQSAVKSKRVEITRFEPSHKFTKDTMRKNVVKNVLFPRYRPLYKSCDWSYPNYHTLNFFTGSTVSEKSCLIYPCSTGSAQTADKDNFPYTPGDTFTFEFWINPRYTTDLATNGPGGGDSDPHYHAGTIMHLSSSYCISLVTGSSIDQDGYPDGFRIMFQLGHAAQTRPHSVNLYNDDGTGSSTNPRFGATLKSNEKLFETRAALGGIEGFDASYTKGRGVIALSNDNSLMKNHWHHVAIRGGKSINNNTGSFYIDGKLQGTFPVCTSDYAGNLMPLEMSTDDGDPDALVVGNYLNTQDFAGNEPMLARFFNVNTAYREGLISMWRDSYDLVAEASGEAAYTDPLAASDFGELTDVKADKIVANGTYSIITVGDTPFDELGAPVGFEAGTIFTATKSGSSLTLAQKTSVNIGRVQKLAQFDFTNPLNAEIHELRIWKEYRSVENIVSGSQSSLTELSGSLMFYVPPWFTKETRKRDVLQTPFQSSRQKTDDPFNVALSFGVGGREINLPNFTRELVQGVSPRLYHLVSSENAGQTEFMSANELLYDAEYTTITGEPVGFRNGQDRGFASIRKGNLTVLPNDNGLFRPNWSLLASNATLLGTFGTAPGSASITYTEFPQNGQFITLTSTDSTNKKFLFLSGSAMLGHSNGSVSPDGSVRVELGARRYASLEVPASTERVTPAGDSASTLTGVDVQQFVDDIHGHTITITDSEGVANHFQVQKNTSVAHTKGTATVTITSQVTSGGTIKITSVDGTERTYTASNGSRFSNNIFDGGESANFSDSYYAQKVAESLKVAIEHSSGHNGDIAVARSGGTLTLTQSSAGSAGNTAITENMSNTTATSFTGGATEAGSTATLSWSNSVSSLKVIPKENHQITLVSTDGTSRTYCFKFYTAGNSAFDPSPLPEGNIRVPMSDSGGSPLNADDVFDNLRTAILSASGHNGKILCSDPDTGDPNNGSMTLTQATPGPTGDRPVICNGHYPEPHFAFTDFSGGTLAAAATATITITGAVTAGQTIQITASGGSPITYTCVDFVSNPSSPSRNFVGGEASSKADIAASALKSAIEHSRGHAGKITVTKLVNVLTLTQTTSGPPRPGVNTSIVESLENTSVVDNMGAGTFTIPLQDAGTETNVDSNATIATRIVNAINDVSVFAKIHATHETPGAGANELHTVSLEETGQLSLSSAPSVVYDPTPASTEPHINVSSNFDVLSGALLDTTYQNLANAIIINFGASIITTHNVNDEGSTRGVLSLRQGRNGASGNTKILHNLSNATVTDFSGGEDDDPLTGTATDKFVDAFGAQNLGLISLEQMVSTGSIPEGLVDITSEFRGIPGIGASKAQAEITWTENVAIEDKATIKLTSHNGKVVTYKFLNDTLISRANGTIDEDGSVIVDARTSVDSLDEGALGGTGNINDVWYRFMLAVNGFRKLVTAGSFKTGETYKIYSVGTTNFTAIGASNNNVGTDFVATGPGEGTGTALEKTDDTFMLAFAPSMQGGASYDNFNPDMTSLIVEQSIKGTSGNTSI